MQCNALVPVKSLEQAKSRLAKSMSLHARKTFVLQMLDHVLTVLHASQVIDQITVVTPDPLVRKHALAHETIVLHDVHSGYNPALTGAALREKQSGSQKLLTIAADLPFLKQIDITQLVRLSVSFDVVIAPSKDNGTNAILMPTPLALPYLFGSNSAASYQNAAHEKSFSIGVYTSKTISFDIDTPEDFAAMKQMITVKD